MRVVPSGERHRAISFMAKSRAFDIMSPLFALLSVLYSVTGVGTGFLAGLLAANLLSPGLAYAARLGGICRERSR